MDKLSFIASDDRQYNVSRVLSLIKSDVVSMVKNANNVVIKPSSLVSDLSMAATHADALEALLAFISPYVKNQIILADGCVKGNTLEAFKNYHYFKIQDHYDFAIVDLNHDDFVEVALPESSGRFKIARTIIDADCLITICPPRSDNVAAYSGALKNIFEGSCQRQPLKLSQKFVSSFKRNKFSSDSTLSREFLTAILPEAYRQLPPVLSIIDGYTTLHSQNSIYQGELAASHWAIAATNPVLADYLTCLILQIDYGKISYLSPLIPEDINDQIVQGDDWHKHQQKIKLPPAYD